MRRISRRSPVHANFMTETIKWIDFRKEVPDAEIECLVLTVAGDVFAAAYDGDGWYLLYQEDTVPVQHVVRFWAHLPTGPVIQERRDEQ